MKLLALNCKQCGAPIEVLATAESVTCDFCEARLSVQHTGGTSFTQALDELRERTRKLEKTLGVRTVDKSLRRLDRSWRRRRKGFMVEGRVGMLRVPRRWEASFVRITGVVFSSFLFFAAALIFQEGASGTLSWLLVLAVTCLVGGILLSRMIRKKVDGYHEAHKNYIELRRKKLRELRGEDARPIRTHPPGGPQ